MKKIIRIRGFELGTIRMRSEDFDHRAIDYIPTWFFVRILVSIYMLIGSRYKDSLYNVLLRLIFD